MHTWHKNIYTSENQGLVKSSGQLSPLPRRFISTLGPVTSTAVIPSWKRGRQLKRRKSQFKDVQNKKYLDTFRCALTMVSSGFQQSVKFMGETRRSTIFQNINPWKSVIQPKDMFNSWTYVSAQEHGTLRLIFFIINKKWALRWQIRVLLVIECAAAHKLKPGLSLTVIKVNGTCQHKHIHCSHVISWNLPCPHKKSFIANDKDIANHDGKIFKTEGRKILASRPLRQKSCTLPMAGLYDQKAIKKTIGDVHWKGSKQIFQC